jgi:hypothetical protein
LVCTNLGVAATNINADTLILLAIFIANNPPNDQPSNIGLLGKILIANIGFIAWLGV